MSTIKVTNLSPQSGNTIYLTGSLTISETLIAKEVRTELTQSVTLFQSGSTQFGDTADDTHTFTGDVTVNGSLSLSGSDFIFTGSTAQMLLEWPSAPNEFHFLQTDAFTVNNPVLGNRTYEYAAWALDHYESGSGAYHNAFKWYMFDSEDKNFGNEILLSPYLIRSLVIASGSNNVALMTLRDQADGTTTARLDANNVYIGDNQSNVSIRGGVTFIGQITSSNGIHVSGSLTVLEGVNAVGGFTGSADFGTLVNKPTLISSSAQIADNISGSFVAASSSIATDIDALQLFSSSLDATYATDTQLNTATASLSSSLATDIATKADSGSFATDIASLTSDSGSFSTRVTDLETLYFVKRHRTENIVYPGSYTGVTIDFTTGSLDYGSTDAMWSSGTDRFTPTVAGLWHFKAQADVYGGASAENGINIYKNGTIEAGIGNIGAIRPQVSTHLYMNGSTDYVEIQAYSQNGATRGQSASTCFFEAKLIKAD